MPTNPEDPGKELSLKVGVLIDLIRELTQSPKNWRLIIEFDGRYLRWYFQRASFLICPTVKQIKHLLEKRTQREEG